MKPNQTEIVKHMRELVRQILRLCDKLEGLESLPEPPKPRKSTGAPSKPVRWAAWEDIAGFFSTSWLCDSSKNPAPFMEAWAEWCEHRQRRQKPMSELTVKRIIRKLEKMGHDRAIEAIHTSIDSKWPGIFEPKSSAGQRADSRAGKHEARAEARRGEYPEPDKPPLPRL